MAAAIELLGSTYNRSKLGTKSILSDKNGIPYLL
jgi:hypothetical protein